MKSTEILAYQTLVALIRNAEISTVLHRVLVWPTTLVLLQTAVLNVPLTPTVQAIKPVSEKSVWTHVQDPVVWVLYAMSLTTRQVARALQDIPEIHLQFAI